VRALDQVSLSHPRGIQGLAALKRRLLIVAGVLGLVLVLGGLLVFRTLRAWSGPELERQLLAQARATLGTDVRVQTMKVSLLRGFELRGVTIANPAPLTGELVTAERLSLGYDLWPLLRGRLKIDELSATKPVIRLRADGRGQYNYERLKVYAGDGGRAPSTTSAGSSVVRELVIERLAMTDAELSLADGKTPFFRLDDVDFESRLTFEADKRVGQGKARIATLALGNALFLRGISSPLTLSKQSLRLEPVEARLAEGDVEGKIRLDLEPDLRWLLDVRVKGASMPTLLKEAGFRPTVIGKLAASALLAGTGGAPTAKGKATAEVKDCKVKDQAVLALVAAALQLPELADPSFEECRAELDIAAGVARTNVLSLKGRTLELTGKGTYGLVTSSLDYDMTLALSPELLSRIPGNTTRAAFKKRADGFGLLDFGVTGTADAPKVDLVARLGASLAKEAAKEGLRKFLERRVR
jgi:uncharacterized protein involved in outer membrane biogenesis